MKKNVFKLHVLMIGCRFIFVTSVVQLGLLNPKSNSELYVKFLIEIFYVGMKSMKPAYEKSQNTLKQRT